MRSTVGSQLSRSAPLMDLSLNRGAQSWIWQASSYFPETYYVSGLAFSPKSSYNALSTLFLSRDLILNFISYNLPQLCTHPQSPTQSISPCRSPRAPNPVAFMRTSFLYFFPSFISAPQSLLLY